MSEETGRRAPTDAEISRHGKYTALSALEELRDRFQDELDDILHYAGVDKNSVYQLENLVEQAQACVLQHVIEQINAKIEEVSP